MGLSDMHDRVAVDGIAFDFHRQGGNIRNLTIEMADGSVIQPLHAAPWVDGQEELPSDLHLVEKQLAGDFFCAPFGGNPGLPIHGWTANGDWEREAWEKSADGSKSTSYRLQQSVLGAQVKKTFTLVPKHPFLYQSHQFTGGSGHLPIAHHAMIHVPARARLSFSKKQFGVTPNDPLESDPERGISLLAYPQTIARLTDVAASNGDMIDITTYPFTRANEDMAALAEDAASTIGWSAALAAEDGFLFFAIKDARVLPETLLWMSNGGRHYAPWLGRHTAVLGIEEAATSCHDSGNFKSAPRKSRHGLACGLVLDENKTTNVRYGFGAIRPPLHWTEIADIRTAAQSVTLVDKGGDEMTLPFLGSHFGL